MILRVLITDLVAVVPDADGAWILFPNAVKGGTRFDDTPLDPHFPVALFNTGEADGSDWPKVKEELVLFGGREGTIWRLDREEIVLPTAGEFSFTTGNATGTFPTEATAGDLFWVPQLRDLGSTESATVDDECIATPCTTSKVIARIRVSSGRLSTHTFARRFFDNKPPEVGAFEFRVSADGGAVGSVRAVADTLLAEIQLPEESVTIKAVKFDGSGERTISLRPKAGQDFVEVLLTNISPTPEVVNLSSGDHFDYYYNLAVEPKKSEDRVIPFLVDSDSDTAPRAGMVDGLVPEWMYEVVRNDIGALRPPICAVAILTK